MTVSLPADLAGELEPSFPDAERVVQSILGRLENVQIATWLPPNFEPPIIQVQRIGGGPDLNGITDYPLMRVAYYGLKRDDAWNLAAMGQKVILHYAHRRAPNGILVDSAELDVGGALDPDLDPDDRRVTENYVLGFRKQYPQFGA